MEAGRVVCLQRMPGLKELSLFPYAVSLLPAHLTKQPDVCQICGYRAWIQDLEFSKGKKLIC